MYHDFGFTSCYKLYKYGQKKKTIKVMKIVVKNMQKNVNPKVSIRTNRNCVHE